MALGPGFRLKYHKALHRGAVSLVCETPGRPSTISTNSSHFYSSLPGRARARALAPAETFPRVPRFKARFCRSRRDGRDVGKNEVNESVEERPLLTGPSLLGRGRACWAGARRADQSCNLPPGIWRDCGGSPVLPCHLHVCVWLHGRACTCAFPRARQRARPYSASLYPE